MVTEIVNSDGTLFEVGMEVMLTPKEAAAILAVTTTTLTKYANKGRLRCIRLESGHRRYPASAIRAATKGNWDEAGDGVPLDEMSPADVVIAVEG